MNSYIIVWGVKVSGSIIFSALEVIRGDSLDEAYNAKYLEGGEPRGDCVIMEVHKITYDRVVLERII